MSAQRYADVNAPAFQPIFPFFPGIRTYRDTTPHGLWWKARAISGYPELEWTYPHMVNRVVVGEQLIPAHFYEPISSFDKARFIVTLAAHLHGSRKRVAPPGVELGFRYFDSAYYAPAGVLKVPDGDDPYRGQHSALARYHDDPDLIAFFGWRHDWGDNGIGYMSRQYFDEHVTSVMASWVSMGGPSRAFYSMLEKGRRPETRDVLRAWGAPNQFQSDTQIMAGARPPASVLGGLFTPDGRAGRCVRDSPRRQDRGEDARLPRCGPPEQYPGAVRRPGREAPRLCGIP